MAIDPVRLVLGPVNLAVVMPDGRAAWGQGDTFDEAKADARQRWARWKRTNPLPLPIDGREYSRRRKARARRKSR
jgi:hypothetical protein